MNEEGSTTLEALVAALIISIVAASAAFAFFVGIRTWAANGESIAISSAALRADDALRASCRDIRIPYWARSASLEQEIDGWSVPFWRGAEDDALIIYGIGSNLTIKTPGMVRSLPETELLSVIALPESGECLRGLDIRYEIRGKAYSTKAIFGSAPLGDL